MTVVTSFANILQIPNMSYFRIQRRDPLEYTIMPSNKQNSNYWKICLEVCADLCVPVFACTFI